MKKTLLLLSSLIIIVLPGNAQKIFKVEYESQADLKVYFVDYESQSDLKIYIVKYESEAGWRDTKKMHLLKH